MKLLATLALLASLATSAGAAVVHDESVQGDLSNDPANPTALVFGMFGNTVIGSVANSAAPTGDRDFIRFTIPPGMFLVALNLLAYSPSNLSFTAFNAGTTGFIPGAGTIDEFLSGIHIGGTNVGSDLMPLYVTNSVTTNALPTPYLSSGNYVFVIQQTSNLVTSYSLEFFLVAPDPTENQSWGAIKALYR